MMTENQWNTVGGSSGQHTDAVPGTTPVTTADAEVGPASKTDAAKEEASNIAGHAAAAAQGVSETAKEEVANVAAEAKSSAQDLLAQAKSGLSSQAGTQQQKAAEGIRTISSQLQTMADAPGQQGIASDLIRQAADRTSSAASWLENRDPGAILTEVQTFARSRPGTFLLLAAGAGILVGRLGRGLQAGAPESAAAIPRRPVPAPALGTTATSGIGGTFNDGPVAPPTAYGETVYGEPARPAFSGTESGGVPLKNVDDPYDDIQDVGRHL